VFNTLTQAAVYAADQLFATLDPTLRQIRAPHFGNLVLADTVGFIRHLPHGLVESFHATLEEVCQASLLLHVVDASDLEKKDNIEAVNSVLEEIHADRVPSLLVFNKIDLTGQPARIERDEHGMPVCVWLSAIKNDGLNLLMDAVIERLNYDRIQCCFRLSPKQSGVRAKLHRFNAIVSEEFDEAGNCLIEANLSVPEFYRLG
jgi:GTP-binding protein HflX